MSKIKAEKRKATLVGWKLSWASEAVKAAWTHRILSDFSRWLGRSNRFEVSYYLTQALTGYGCFKHYLLKRKRARDPTCVYYEYPQDTAEHTLFYCPNWTMAREAMSQCLRRPPRPEDVEEILCGPVLD